jgi:hypothetical protein
MPASTAIDARGLVGCALDRCGWQRRRWLDNCGAGLEECRNLRDCEAARDVSGVVRACAHVWLTLSRALRTMAALEPDETYSDQTLLRFLRARNFNISRAAALITEVQKWRDSYAPQLITLESVMPELVLRKAYVCGQDTRQRPCLLFIPARHRSRDSDLEMSVRFFVCLVEKVLQFPSVSEISCVVDFAGFNLASLEYTLVKNLLVVFQTYYP